ncbi:DNA-directed RNA polymerases IV and V subunit 2 [Hibiscus syriacus]|uniref:DNA-directed RNA polymerase n=1 Tax=Hibiscus syriacus TaxID=106335 RepID=A0A6A3AYV6_HIBSY|nr:DNA-directed RNA polymerases IV and V subunit 2 [Hibiscus syriacus]
MSSSKCVEYLRANKVQNVLGSFKEFVIHSGYDSKKGEGDWRHARVRFGKVTVDRPTFWTVSGGKELNMLPRHARLQNMTYSSRVKVHVDLEVYTAKSVKSDKFKTGQEEMVEEEVAYRDNREILIGRIPVMVRSNLCWLNEVEKANCDFDYGGYFLIKGSEKVCLSFRLTCYLLSILHGSWTGLEYIHRTRAISLKRLWISNVQGWTVAYRSEVKRNRLIIRLVENSKIEHIQEGEKILTIYFLSIEIPVWILFFALGVVSDKEVVDLIGYGSYDSGISNILFVSIQDADWKRRNFREGKNALKHLDKLRKETRFPAEEGAEECLRSDNRDDLRNKRLEMADELLQRELKLQMGSLEHSLLEHGLILKRMERVSGVVANLGRANPLQTMIDLRKTRQQVSYTGKVGDARYPHPSHWGKVCFLSTTDGENCGLVKNLASTALVSTNLMEPIVDKLFDSGMEKVVNDTSSSVDGKYKVFLNGEWVGVCEDSLSFAAELRRNRRRKELPFQVEVKRDEHKGEVRIFSDAGRIMRPLLVVENLFKLKSFKGKDNYTFQSLLDQGIVELIAAEEEEDCHTAWDIKYLFADVEVAQPVKYTHCELDMSFLLSLSCGTIPFANHDHSRRVLYQAQNILNKPLGFLQQTQTSGLTLCLTECQNRMQPKPELYNGQNAIVAVNVRLGYNQEDSMVINRASIERGMFRTEHVRSYKAEVENTEIQERRQKPEDIVKFGKIESKIGRVDSLDDDGFLYIGDSLQSGGIVIGRFAESGADHGVKLKHTERGMVQKVVLSSNDDGKNFAVVSLRQVRYPCLGDKFSSMHGKKGVLGFLESHENFPFTTQGIVPDIVINPHAFPTRQTPGQLLETALGKGIACGGSMKYATPFSTHSLHGCHHRTASQVMDNPEQVDPHVHCALIMAGFSRWGNERVYNGRTGEMVHSLIFMGPTFYQRLVHMSEDKVKFRNTGPVHPLTWQPVADRKRYGGIKFGEMERDCLIAHGASANLRERFFTLSDSSQMHVCQNCKNTANDIERAVAGG